MATYCTIKYGDNSSNADNTSENPNVTSSSSKTSLCKNKEFVVNLKCRIRILLDYVAYVIGFDASANFCFCDESGHLVKVKSFAPLYSALKILEPLKTYVVVLYECDSNNRYTKLEPILNKHSKAYSNVMERIKKQVSLTRRPSSESKIRRKSSLKTNSIDNTSTLNRSAEEQIGSMQKIVE